MKILVTGASGDLGRDLSPILSRYYDVITTDIRKPDNNLEFIRCDITQPEDVKKATKDIDVIIHLAALLSCETSNPFIDVNVKGTCNILEAALENNIKKVIYASSVWAAARGGNFPYLPIDEDIPCKPEGMYDITKRMGEEFCEYFNRLYGLNTVNLRLCGYYPVEGFSDNGDIMWDKVDLCALVGRFVGTGPSYKITNPWDLTQAFKAVIETDTRPNDTFIIGLGAPFIQEDAEELGKSPLNVIGKYYPGAAEFFKEIGLEVPAINFWYTTKKAEKKLGFSPRFSLNDIMEMYYSNR
ncbi:NAD-dependent epimerase/dehydratase family protein [Candidatus Poribacteria bacterium]|nr:NAD-dependent epimerase/dehydratase family protein [Candidatus Poribacteria bacterium]